MKLYHGSSVKVQQPQIIKTGFNKDFGFGFYCTVLKEQAIRWAVRYNGQGILTEFEYNIDSNLNILHFEKMTEEWLDFIAFCRNGGKHNYDIVEGPMADDTIFNYVQSFIENKISREAFWALAKFKKPTHQISFNTELSLKTLSYIQSYEVFDEKL